MEIGIQVAENIARQGGKVVPVARGTKTGLAKGWKATTLPEPGSPEFYQAVADKNVALHMGTTFVDVDLDTKGIDRLAKVFLPATPFVYGRKSNPGSHYIYRAPNEQKKRTYGPLLQPGQESHPLLELRSGDCLSLLPGSVHTSGETYAFAAGGVDPNVVEPAEAEWEDLHRRTTLMAICFGSVETYSSSGQRDTMCYCLAGLLCRHGFDQEMSRNVIIMLAKLADDEEWQKRGAKIDIAWAQATQDQGNQNLPGYRKLTEVAGEDYAAWFRKTIRDAAPVGSAEAPDIMDAAEWFSDSYGDELIFEAGQGIWYQWGQTHWSKLDAKPKDYGSLELPAMRAVKAVGLKLTRASLIDDAMRVSSRLMTKAVFRPKSMILNLPTGTWDLESGEVYPHTKEDGLTSILPYMPQAGPCPQIDAFLAQTVPDAAGIKTIEEHVGLALLEDRGYHKVLVLVGPGRSGKSTIGHLASMVCGEDPDSQPTAELMDSGNEGRLSRVNWNHLRLAHISEFPAEAFQSGAEIFKAMVGHNSVRMRHHYKEEERKNRWGPKLLLTTNDAPRFIDPGNAVENRLLVVSCPNSRADDPEGIDEKLRDKLATEIPQWGFRCLFRALLLVVGAQKGYTESTWMRSERRKLMLKGDPIQGWAEECLVADAEGFAGRDDLYASFKQYLDSVGKNRIIQSRMLDGLAGIFPESREERKRVGTKRVRGLVGLRLRKDGDDTDDQGPDSGPQGPAPQEGGPNFGTRSTDFETVDRLLAHPAEGFSSGGGFENKALVHWSTLFTKFPYNETISSAAVAESPIDEAPYSTCVVSIGSVEAQKCGPVDHPPILEDLYQSKPASEMGAKPGPQTPIVVDHPLNSGPLNPVLEFDMSKTKPATGFGSLESGIVDPLAGQLCLFPCNAPQTADTLRVSEPPSAPGDLLPLGGFPISDAGNLAADSDPANPVTGKAKQAAGKKNPAAGTLLPATPLVEVDPDTLEAHPVPEYGFVVPAWVADAEILALDTETAKAQGTHYDQKENRTALDPHAGRLRLLTLSDGTNTLVVDTWQHVEALRELRPYIEDPTKTIVAHNAGFDQKWLLAAGYDIGVNWADTMLMSKVLDGGLHHDGGYHKLATVAQRILAITLDKSEQASDWAAPLTQEQLDYAGLDAQVLPALYHKLTELLHTEDLIPTAQVENRAVSAVAAMEYQGIAITPTIWSGLADKAVDKVSELGPKLHELLGPINMNSHVQLKKALAEHGIVVDKTDKETLHDALVAVQLAPDQDGPLVQEKLQILGVLKEYKEHLKNSTTYGHEWLAKNISPTTHRVHAHFNQIVDTGRFSCASPNIQNLPKGEYRTAFTAPEGKALLKVDYTAIELRIAAALAQDPVMLSAFNNSEDLHKRTAALLLGKTEAECTKADRQIAKSANFGLLYGSGVETLRAYAASSFGVAMTSDQAAKYRAAWFRAYPAIKRWQTRETGYLQSGDAMGQADIWVSDDSPKDTRTMLGRIRRRVPTYTQKLNSPVQGTGADGLKMAMGDLHADRQAQPSAKLVACVHDELVFECPLEDAPAVAAWIEHHMVAAMTRVVQSQVLIEAEATICQDWSGKEFPKPEPLTLVA